MVNVANAEFIPPIKITPSPTHLAPLIRFTGCEPFQNPDLHRNPQTGTHAQELSNP